MRARASLLACHVHCVCVVQVSSGTSTEEKGASAAVQLRQLKSADTSEPDLMKV